MDETTKEELTKEELESIVKAITAWNNGKLEFDSSYLKYADIFGLKVKRTGGMITITVDMPTFK